MKAIIAQVIHYLFLSYTVLLFIRLVASWIPRWRFHSFVRFASFLTDPYLNLFRRFIPPIGGALDLSPIIGFFVLDIAERICVGFLRG